ncbi:MAG: YbgA family protein [Gemmatimonadota bacterium]
MSDFPRPTVVVSRCLEFEAVRYDGRRIPDDFIRRLESLVTYVPVCPEIEIGLGVPRDPIRLVRVGKGERLVQPATGRELTREMTRFAKRFLDRRADLDGFILKSRSPSCGTRDVKVHPDAEATEAIGRRAGVFAAAVLHRFPDLAVENEDRLGDLRLREHFLTKLFALARLRGVERSGHRSELVRFHEAHRLLLLAYHRTQSRALDRLMASANGTPFPELAARYRERFGSALRRPPRSSSAVRVARQVAEHLSDRLGREERARLGAAVRAYRERRLPVGALSDILRSWAARFPDQELRDQAFLDPYPAALRR